MPLPATEKPIRLDFIDFVKIQTGVNALRPEARGEISTEVGAVQDHNMIKINNHTVVPILLKLIKSTGL